MRNTTASRLVRCSFLALALVLAACGDKKDDPSKKLSNAVNSGKEAMKDMAADAKAAAVSGYQKILQGIDSKTAAAKIDALQGDAKSTAQKLMAKINAESGELSTMLNNAMKADGGEWSAKLEALKAKSGSLSQLWAELKTQLGMQ